jgi:hypothetical protein
MPVVALPDMLGALIARLRSFPEVRAFVETAAGYVPGTPPDRRRPRVSAELQDTWAMPTYATLLNWAGGPPGDQHLRVHRTRVDTRWYGPTSHDAKRLWRTGHAALCPGLRASSAFDAAGCRVADVEQETGPLATRDPDAGNAHVVIVPYVVTWSGVPLP